MPQQAQNTYRIAPPSDRAILTLFEQIVGALTDATISISIGSVIVGSARTVGEFVSAHPHHDWDSSKIISQLTAHSNAQSVIVFFSRTVTEFSGGNLLKSASRWENEIWIDQPGAGQSRPSPETVLTLSTLIDNFRTSFSSEAALDRSPPSPERDAFSTHLARLSELHAQILHDAERTRLKWEEQLIARQAEMEREFEGRQKAQEAAFATERQVLASAREELDRDRKTLDDRGHMHARRELRANISTDLKARLARPSVSPGVRAQRGSFLGIGLFGLVALAAYAFYAAIDVHQLITSKPAGSIESLIAATIRFSLAAAGAAGLLFYVLGWMKQVHSEDVRAERDLERYLYDIDRASWAIETILEANEKETAKVPAKWIEGVTRSLFTRQAPKPEHGSELEALGSLLDVAAKAEFGPGGPKIQITKRGLKQLRKSSAEHDDEDE